MTKDEKGFSALSIGLDDCIHDATAGGVYDFRVSVPYPSGLMTASLAAIQDLI